MAIVTIDGIPVYDAVISDDDTGMFRISLVDEPAVMVDFQAFKNGKRPQMYAVSNEGKHLVRGVVMRADFPIYRRDNKVGEYYVIYKADQIRAMAEKYLKESRQNDVNLMHEEGSDVDGVQMVQYFIKDAANGVNPSGFEDISDGSLFAEFHIVNDDVWQEIKAGTYKGFSLEGVFEMVPETDKDEIQQIVDDLDGAFSRLFKHCKNKMSKLSRFKAALAKMLQSLGSMTTDKGVLTWDGDDDLAVGNAVSVEDADGNTTPASDGEYTSDEGKIYVVEGGKVTDIKDSEPITSGASQELSSLETDAGTLNYEGELAEGTEVTVTEEDGNNTPAPDGDYKTSDGKIITVKDGKVTAITEAPKEDADVKARRERYRKIRSAFEESYSDKIQEIQNAVAEVEPNGYVYDAGDDFAIVSTYNEETGEVKLFRYALSWDENGNAVLGDSEEVKQAFVPVSDNGSDSVAEENKALKKENAELKAKVAKLQKQPAGKPAHTEFKKAGADFKTGNKGLDNLSRILSAK